MLFCMLFYCAYLKLNRNIVDCVVESFFVTTEKSKRESCVVGMSGRDTRNSFLTFPSHHKDHFAQVKKKLSPLLSKLDKINMGNKRESNSCK